MDFGLCILSVVPVRAEAREQAEMVTQLLFGELFTVIDKKQQWFLIRAHNDDYQGWVSKNQVQLIGDEEFHYLSSCPYYYSFEFINKLNNTTHHSSFPIVLGSTLYANSGNTFSLHKQNFLFKGRVLQAKQIPDKAAIPKYARLYLNTPYLWGGRSPVGIDCSGFTQMVYRLAGINIHRDASQQAIQGKALNDFSEAEAGDLAFFDNEQGNICHTGIILPHAKIIHASGRVKINSIDKQGIYDQELQAYTHKLCIVKNYVCD